MIDRQHDLPITKQAEVLRISRLLGPADLVREFIAGQTARASAAQNQIREEATGKPPADARVIELKNLVHDVRVWANDPGSGGDIAQVFLEAKTNSWRWIHRPKVYPEN
jgi:hypothetical protein